MRLCKPYQILIADDDPGFREAVRDILEPYFQTLEAASGEEAVQISSGRRVDVALLDMHMRRLTGLETLRILKSRNAVTPCILITGDATDQLRRDAGFADAFSVLNKPLSKSDLVRTVRTAFERVYQEPNVFQFSQTAVGEAFPASGSGPRRQAGRNRRL